MGKSPGKWIKTVLLGKKISKSKFSHSKKKAANVNEVHVQVMTPETGIDGNPQEVHSGGGLSAVRVDEHIPSPTYKIASTQQDEEAPFVGGQNAVVEQTKELDMLTESERRTREKAATKTQAAFRGYLARCAFKVLRGIIRLQALIRGHLVRRQAVATLRCVVGIVKLQALIRGSRIRCSDAGIEVQKVCTVKPLKPVFTTSASLTSNSFIRKLLNSSPEGMPLRVQYDETDSNSVQIWLARWSTLCPWKPTSPPTKSRYSKIQKKQGNSQLQAAAGEIVTPKHSVRRVPSIFDNTSAQLASKLKRPQRNQNKVSCHPADSAKENPRNEVKKVKCSLRKVQNPVVENSVPSDVTETPPQGQVETMNTVENITEETGFISKDEALTTPKENGHEIIEDTVETSQSTEIENVKVSAVISEPFEGNEKDGNDAVLNGDLRTTGESVLSENLQTRERASLTPVKKENVDDGLQKTPKLPGYMQATKSAKAKLRGLGSPKLNQGSAEKPNFTRRYSLPSPENGKVNSVSPRTPKPLKGSGKGGNKNDKSLASSRDGNGKAIQGWRR